MLPRNIQIIRGAADTGNGPGRDMGINFRSLAAAVAQQFLDNAQIRSCFQEVGSVAVPQAVHRCRFFSRNRYPSAAG